MPVLLFSGDNRLELDEAVRTLRQPFEQADVLTFEGADVPLPTLSEACLTAGLFDPERLVIVQNLHERMKGGQKAGEASEEVRKVLANLVPTTTLLLVCPDMPPDHQLAMVVREVSGTVRSFQTPRKGELPRWLVARGKKRGIAIEQDAAELLTELAGSNPLLLESELEKLATYAGEGQRISPRMVDNLVGTVPQDSIFTLVDAIAAGDKARALQLLHAQLDHASSGPIDFALYLIRMLARQMRILLRIRLGQEAGRSRSQITSDLKLPRYYADRYFQQANRLSKERLKRAFEQLAALEYGLKSGRVDASTGVDLLVAELCS
jgi:DNA polymerase-3 subunit delta